ncbi:HTH domain protein (plasmid) [Natrialba magadii ATCC 43099]|uniref:HTH domain protein n=1 Tax=Natrialba magadii (strain ATCC 43099 / DSM 3394 / CCM 3739 / CIP 104546 / IAM 13178 / JCM 8861 / NBRC 102185 / NCIMB 2190 / MS3) TaxID=547559 RepID=D3T227_NATMM|nr:helix-turn-helix transcriptional regulator [Natrialba magadii]ADD07636.1 HTH domain protein [Natrialba magadii ATCC 43099]ELY27115.1 hypothetical protein C500_14795 [Natrialba magadii ATCC 43099]
MMTEEANSPSSMDIVLNVLENRYRRRMLVALLEHNPQDADNPQLPADSELAAEDLETRRIHMRHSHLPKLEESGFIEWDRDTNSVRKGPHFDEIQPLLEVLQNHANKLPDG